MTLAEGEKTLDLLLDGDGVPEELNESIPDDCMFEVVASARVLSRVLKKRGEEVNVPRDARGLYIAEWENHLPDGEEGAFETNAPRIYLVAAPHKDKDEFRETLIHEIGHAAGLSEDEVEGMGM